MKHIISNQDFENILKTEIVVVDFHADWCGPCRMIGPIIESLNNKYTQESRILISKLDVDKVPGVARTYNVSSIPTIIFFHNGKEYGRVLGYRPEKYIDDVISGLLKK